MEEISLEGPSEAPWMVPAKAWDKLQLKGGDVVDCVLYDYEHSFSIISCSIMLQTIPYIVHTITRVCCVHVTKRNNFWLTGTVVCITHVQY